jgi:hypothetical protein
MLVFRQVFADEDAFWSALEAREHELRDVLDAAATLQEQRAARADLASIAWLTNIWDAVQHNARCLKNFVRWLETPPSREKLFAEYCRHAVPVEWDQLLVDGSPPFIFPSNDAYHLHMEHCQLCDAQRQLAEGRRLRAEPNRPTYGDRLVRDFLITYCGEALAAVCDPAPQRQATVSQLSVWSEAPELQLVVAPGARLKARGDFEVEIPARLRGPCQPGRFELTVTAQHIDGATRQAEPALNVWPQRRGEAVLDWRPTSQGWRELPLLVPAPAAPGRMILRYAVRSRSARAPAPSEVNALVVDFLSRARE